MKFAILLVAAVQSTIASPIAPKNSTKTATIPEPLKKTGSNTAAKKGKAFSLVQIPNPSYKGPDATSDLLCAHAKHGQQLPEQLKTAIESNHALKKKFGSLIQSNRSTGSVPAYPAPADSEYVIPVEIGTPPQHIHLDLDTGSSDLWVFSSDTNEREVSSHSIYRPDESSTSHPLYGETWVVHYGDGSGASGDVYEDVVGLGETSFAHQAVESALEVSSAISSDPFSSGIMGMASSAANMVRPDPQVTYIQNIQDQLAEALFTANLLKGQPGNYNFGYVDNSEYTGNITYTPIDVHTPLYQVSVEGYQVGSEDYRSYAWDSIVDTGTSQLLMPRTIVDNYYSDVSDVGMDPYTNMRIFPCSAKLPDFYFGIGNHRGLVPGSYINYGNYNRTHCYGGIQSSEGIPFGVFGDVMLKSQFVVFNLGTVKLGFANKKLD